MWVIINVQYKLIMAPCTSEIGKVIREMDLENNFMKMVQYMKVNGKMIIIKDMED